MKIDVYFSDPSATSDKLTSNKLKPSHCERRLLKMHLPSLFLFSVAALSTGVSAVSQPTLLVGAYTRIESFVNGTSKGIHSYKIDVTTGVLTPWAVTRVGINPVYVQGTRKSFDNGKPVIYAVNAVSEKDSTNSSELTGYVSALTLNDDGSLKVLNTLETHGERPIHISVSPDEDFVVVSNHGGSITMFSVNASGYLADETFHENFNKGIKVVEDQQSHQIHSTAWVPGSMNLVAANVGFDELLQYKLNPKKQTLNGLKTVETSLGFGPRHMVFHSGLNMAYVVGEFSNTVCVFPIDTKKRVLSTNSVQEISTLPSNFTNFSSGADIHLSSNGKFLYMSNGGHDSIAMFKINDDGTLISLGWESTRGSFPRGFIIYGSWLIVANQNSNNMHVFKVDSKTGLLTYTRNSYQINSAVSFYVVEN